MSQAEGDQSQAIEYPCDSQAIIADGEAEVPPVPVSSEPGVEHPDCCRHHRCLATSPPDVHGGGGEEDRHS